MHTNNTQTAAQQRIQTLASQCVRCGLCLPVCPTYRLDPCEAESPRGRIALLAAVAQGELTATASLHQHIDQCLGCRSCEAVCPAFVPYEDLLMQGRALLNSKRNKALPWLWRLLTHSTRWRRRLFAFYRLGQYSGLLKLARYLILDRALGLARWLSYCPRVAENTFVGKGFYPATTTRRGSVVLLIGCSGDVLEPQSLKDALMLLNRWGFDVNIPADQGCCGALHAHAGQQDHAAVLAQKNAVACNTARVDALIGITTGCYSTWQANTALTAPYWDIQHFLLSHWPESLTPPALMMKVAIHQPCSQRNALRKAALSQQLLAKIPGLQCQSFGQTSCCGAAGDYFISQAALSDQLGAQVVKELSLSDCDAVVSANLGCRLQLLKHWDSKTHPTPKFYHPISLLAMAFQRTDDRVNRFSG